MIVSIFLRHYKAYKNIYFTPVTDGHMFNAYVGNNGMGKSSILEALDTFFNGKAWNINKEGMEKGVAGTDKTPFIAPVFLIKKDKVQNRSLRGKLQELSDFFWKIDKKAVQAVKPEFFEQRDRLIQKFPPSEYYFFVIGKRYDSADIYFSGFHNALLRDQINFSLGGKTLEDGEQEFQEKFKGLLKEVINIFAYIYIPVESDVQDTTKLETRGMQELMNKDLKEQIGKAIKQKTLDDINHELATFLDEIEEDLQVYCYETPKEKTKKNLTKPDLITKIVEEYFTIRVLSKKVGRKKIPVKNLSAGEKRQALINAAYAFLKKGGERSKMIILAIDEPEASLHTSACFSQFRKLQSISKAHQIIITTHWYGFLPVIREGIAHFLSNDEDTINFETYDLFSYRTKIKKDKEESRNEIPKDFVLKSTNDLVQSIYYSLQESKNPYNWLICEGISEKLYFEHFFKKEIADNNLVILPVGGAKAVVKIFRHLLLPLQEARENKDKNFKGRVYCVIDTDKDQPGRNIGRQDTNNLRIRKLYNDDNTETTLALLDKPNNDFADIEDCLSPVIFKRTLKCYTADIKLDIDITDSNNTGAAGLDLKGSEYKKLKDFFDLDDGERKVKFAEKYLEILSKEERQQDFTPKWINEIGDFFTTKKISQEDIDEVLEAKDAELNLEEIRKNWKEIIKQIDTPFIKMSFMDCEPIKYEKEELYLAFNSSTFMDKIANSGNQAIVQAAIKKVLGKNIKLNLQTKGK